uniref:Uncharacterized protein n=1 Tax=Parastrongyloides trichosuri TaxID=131310 RepID=A0A0N4ZXE5_PARTI
MHPESRNANTTIHELDITQHSESFFRKEMSDNFLMESSDDSRPSSKQDIYNTSSPTTDTFIGNLSTINEIIDNDKENYVEDGQEESRQTLTKIDENFDQSFPKDNDKTPGYDIRDLEVSFLNNEVQVFKSVMYEDSAFSKKIIKFCESNNDIFSEGDQIKIKNGDIKPFERMAENMRIMMDLLDIVKIRGNCKNILDKF